MSAWLRVHPPNVKPRGEGSFRKVLKAKEMRETWSG